VQIKTMLRGAIMYYSSFVFLVYESVMRTFSSIKKCNLTEKSITWELSSQVGVNYINQ